MLEFEVSRLFEEGHVPRVASRPTALDIVDSELVEFLRYAEFCADCEGHSFGLGSVPEGGVVNGDVLIGHDEDAMEWGKEELV